MFCAFFHLLIYYSLANNGLKHFNPTDERTNDKIQKKLSSNIKFKESSKEIVCPDFKGGSFTEIVEGVSGATGNHYACNQKFKNPISITGGVLQIYHCKFAHFISTYNFQNTPISIKSVSDGSVFISNCEFVICEAGCIYLKDVNIPELEITNCYFTRCTSIYNYAVIQFESRSGTISNCYFRDNSGSPANIYYSPGSPEENDQLKINNCVYQIGASKTHLVQNPVFLYFSSNAKIEFTDNDFYIWTVGKIFASKVSDSTFSKFENINMYPYNDANIGSTLPEKLTIGNGDSMDCPEDLPEGVTSNGDTLFCGSVGEPTDGTLINAISFVRVYYSSFNTFKNLNGNGGAAYINIPNQPIDKTASIQFYHSVFMNCIAQNGGAIYLESADEGRLFDFYQCDFNDNGHIDGSNTKTVAGGAIYIKSSVSSFKFVKCFFAFNYATDGAGIYYFSDAADTNTDRSTPLIQMNDCNFYNNLMYNSGGAMSIIITKNPSPRVVEINNCNFIDNKYENDDDKTSDAPESGGAIYYSFEYQSTDSSASQTDTYLHIVDSFFQRNYATIYGGAICILINGPDKLIEIEKCSFNFNFVRFSGSGEDSGLYGKGGAIYYLNSKASQTDNTNPSLNVHDCNFTNCFAADQGGSISIVISNAQSSRPIKINNCLFDDNEEYSSMSSGTRFASELTKNGLFVSYVIESEKDSPSNNNPPLQISGCDFKQTIDRFDSSSEAEKGGCIYLSVNNCQQTGSIAIDHCTFSHKKSSAAESYGGSIYYLSNAATESASSKEVLSITNSVFEGSNVLNYGGSIYIQFTEDNSQKEVTLNNCSFKETTSEKNNDAVYIKSDKNTHNVKFDDCTFDSCMIYFDALSTTIYNCKFNEIGNDKHAIYYASEYTEDFGISLKIDACHFTQASTVVDSLVYFDKKLSSKFIFTNNDIKFTDTTSHVLGCTQGIEIKEETDDNKYWEFSANTLDPNKEAVIKTTDAEAIPAYCITGFKCTPEPRNCDNNTRCDLTGNQSFPSKELINYNYDGLPSEGANIKNGGAIHLINYQLKCVNSHFTGCKAEQGGGGAIFIVADNEPSTQTSFTIERCDFTGCSAQFGGAIYIYSNQQKCDFQMIRCTFDSNTASSTAPEGENSHLFGGAAAYLQTQNSKLIRCTFRKNTGNDVKIYQTDGLNPPSSNSMILSSESSIQISECIFESDKSSSSSLFFVDKKTKNNTPLSVVSCKFVGELPEGAYHIDGESVNKKKLNIMVEKCKFASDRKIALNSKLNVLSFDLKSQQFNYKENESYSQDSLKKRKIGFNLLALVAVEVSAVIVASLAIVIIIKKKNASQVESSDNDEKVIEQNKAEL